MSTVTLVMDDFEQDVPAVATLNFSWEGTEYEIDVSEENLEWARELMAPLVETARKVGKQGRTPKRVRSDRERTHATSPGSDERMAIRDWARANGWPNQSNQGVISKKIMEAYHAAHPDGLASN